jgi:NAD(P)H-hydrate repair Nnr-like enzyme with NAD(P)H-hydrate dehydratase domain
LAEALERHVPTVLDADALVLLGPGMLGERRAPVIATPHEGELTALAKAFGIGAAGKLAIARALAAQSGILVLAKGPDTVIAAPDGRTAIAPHAPSWLSAAGTGDVLAGLVASRLASGQEPFEAACQAAWLHGNAARRAGPAFSASDLIGRIPAAFAACL